LFMKAFIGTVLGHEIYGPYIWREVTDTWENT